MEPSWGEDCIVDLRYLLLRHSHRFGECRRRDADGCRRSPTRQPV